MYADILRAVILGIIEGLTEFIPVSSTGHLILAGDLLEFQHANTATFDIAIQLGAILAVVVLYRDYFKQTFAPSQWFKRDMNNLILAMLPAMALGFLAHKAIKTYLFSSFTVAIGLLVGGIMMLVVERFMKPVAETTEVEKITPKQAFIIGCFQCLALWPGMSRSGSTIIGGLVAKLNYEVAAKFSFLVSVPVMLVAVSYDMLKSYSALSSQDLLLIAIGFGVSFVLGGLSIVFFMKILRKLKLAPFAVYRIVLALFVLTM